MTKDEFLEKIKDILQYEGDLTYESNLLDIDEWDSLSIISIISFFDSKLNKKITTDKLKNIVTVQELINLANIDE